MADTGFYVLGTADIGSVSDIPSGINTKSYLEVHKVTDESTYKIHNTAKKISYIGYQFGSNAEIVWYKIADVDNITTLISIDARNGDTFKEKLKISNKASFFTFYDNPSDNPFSFVSGSGISFQSSILYGFQETCLIGISYGGDKIETKTLGIS